MGWEVGKEAPERGHMFTYCWFMLLYMPGVQAKICTLLSNYPPIKNFLNVYFTLEACLLLSKLYPEICRQIMKILLSNKIRYLITGFNFVGNPASKISRESAFLALCPAVSLVSTLCALNVPLCTLLHLYDGSLYVSGLPPIFTCPHSIPSSSPVHVIAFPGFW